MRVYHVHVHSLRLASGEEALVARVVTLQGRVGYGFSLRLEATEARHMAERDAGVRNDVAPSVPVPPEIGDAFRSIPWLPA